MLKCICCFPDPSSFWKYDYTRCGLPRWARAKEPVCQGGSCGRHGFNSWVGETPWRRAGQPTPVFLPGESMDRGSWCATVHTVAKSRTGLKRLSGYACTSSNCLSHTHLSAPPDFPWLIPSLSSFAPRSAPGPSLPAR